SSTAVTEAASSPIAVACGASTAAASAPAGVAWPPTSTVASVSADIDWLFWIVASVFPARRELRSRNTPPTNAATTPTPHNADNGASRCSFVTAPPPSGTRPNPALRPDTRGEEQLFFGTEIWPRNEKPRESPECRLGDALPFVRRPAVGLGAGPAHQHGP